MQISTLQHMSLKATDPARVGSHKLIKAKQCRTSSNIKRLGDSNLGCFNLRQSFGNSLMVVLLRVPNYVLVASPWLWYKDDDNLYLPFQKASFTYNQIRCYECAPLSGVCMMSVLGIAWLGRKTPPAQAKCVSENVLVAA